MLKIEIISYCWARFIFSIALTGGVIVNVIVWIISFPSILSPHYIWSNEKEQRANKAHIHTEIHIGMLWVRRLTSNLMISKRNKNKVPLLKLGIKQWYIATVNVFCVRLLSAMQFALKQSICCLAFASLSLNFDSFDFMIKETLTLSVKWNAITSCDCYLWFSFRFPPVHAIVIIIIWMGFTQTFIWCHDLIQSDSGWLISKQKSPL